VINDDEGQVCYLTEWLSLPVDIFEDAAVIESIIIGCKSQNKYCIEL